MNKLLLAFAVCTALTLPGCGGHAGHDHDGHSHDGHEDACDNHDAHDGHDHASHSEAEAHGDHGETAGDHGNGAHGNEIILTPEQARAAGVKVEAIQPTEFHAAYATSGQLLAGQGAEQTVAATADGIVHYANASIAEGTHIGKGQTIATLSARDLQDGDAVSKAGAAYEAARSDYERAKKLVADRIISEKAFEQARLAFETARAAYGGVAKNATAAGTAVKVPTGGYVKTLIARQGDYVSMGQPIAIVTQSRRLQLRADVPTNRLAALGSIGGANFRMAGSDRVLRLSDLHGRVLSYGRSVSDGAAFVPVTFELDNVGDLVAGAFAEVWVLSETRTGVLALPTEAFTEEAGIKYIYVQVEPDAYVKREVKTGQSDGQRMEVTAGLKAGERVVTRGAVKVKMASMAASIPAHSHNH